MTLKQQLIHLANLYAEHASDGRGKSGRVSLSAVSTRIFNDGKTMARLESGGDVTTGSFEKALHWFSDNWPDGTAWPDGIARPDPKLAEAASDAR